MTSTTIGPQVYDEDMSNTIALCYWVYIKRCDAYVMEFLPLNAGTLTMQRERCDAYVIVLSSLNAGTLTMQIWSHAIRTI